MHGVFFTFFGESGCELSRVGCNLNWVLSDNERAACCSFELGASQCCCWQATLTMPSMWAWYYFLSLHTKANDQEQERKYQISGILYIICRHQGAIINMWKNPGASGRGGMSITLICIAICLRIIFNTQHLFSKEMADWYNLYFDTLPIFFFNCTSRVHTYTHTCYTHTHPNSVSPFYPSHVLQCCRSSCLTTLITPGCKT